jgi:hypothetical protein
MSENQQNADKIYNIKEIGTANFNTYEGDKIIPRALTKSPFLSEVFIGREADLVAIKEKLFSGDNMLLLDLKLRFFN